MAEEIREIKTKMRGRWRSFFTSRYGSMFSHSRGQACPICSGTDRFSFDDKFGDGNWICRNECSGRISSDGLELLKLMDKTDIKGAITIIKNYLGDNRRVAVNTLEDMEPVLQDKQVIGGTCLVIPAPELQYIPGATITLWMQTKSKLGLFNYEYWFDWLNPDGIQVGYIGRAYKDSKGKKVCHQIFFTEDKGWTQGSLGQSRPAYCPKPLGDKPILITEGEKATEAVLRATTKYAAVTWTGGANSVHLTNWEFLAGREVYIFPDNDEEGIKAANKLQAMIHKTCTVKIIPPPKDVRAKWDIGDLAEEEGDFGGFDEKIDAMIAAQKKTTLENNSEDPNVNIKKLIRPLGFLDGQCYIMHWHKDITKHVYVQEVEGVSSSALNKQKLMFWKDWEDWKGVYGAKIDLDIIIPDIVRACKSKGVYDQTKIRGAGFWNDDGRSMFHAGTRLYLENEIADMAELDSEFIYQSRPPIVSSDFDFSKRLTEEEKKQVLKVLCTMNVSKLASVVYMLGWMILAPQSGRLKWRPHIYIEGKTGSGKSSFFRVLRAAFGPGVEDITDSPTEASIRQRLGSDARPIIFDESEAKNKLNEHEREKINGLKRASCSDSEAMITRGTASGRAQIFKPRFMIAEAGINKPKSSEADLNREIEIEMLHKSVIPDYGDIPFFLEEAMNDPYTFAEAFGQGKSGGIVSEWMDAQFWDRWIAHCDSLWPIIQKNFIIFKQAIMKVADGRAGDTYGWVIAAAAAFLVGEVMADDEATIQAFLDKTIWNTIQERKQEETTELELLRYINQMPIQIEDNYVPRMTTTIVAALAEIKNLWDSTYDAKAGKRESFLGALGLHGITIKKLAAKMGPDEFFVFISNKNQLLAQKMSNTSYYHRWNAVLKRLPGTEANMSFRCPHQQQQKGLKIPYSPYFLCGDDEPEEITTPCLNENTNPEELNIDLF